MRTVPTALLCGFAVVACQASPLQVATPEPVADSVTVPATVSEATAAAASAVTDEGLPLRFFEHAAGIIETDYFDLSGRLTQHEDLGDTDRFIRFRVLVRDANGGSAVAIQVLHNPWRPTAINRYYERAVPPDHPGNELGRRLLRSVKRAVSQAAPRT